jgi:hypothetical protein
VILGRSVDERNDILRSRACQWQRWFAWHPVALVDGRWVWLQHVYRQPSLIEGLLTRPGDPRLYVEEYRYRLDFPS